MWRTLGFAPRMSSVRRLFILLILCMRLLLNIWVTNNGKLAYSYRVLLIDHFLFFFGLKKMKASSPSSFSDVFSYPFLGFYFLYSVESFLLLDFTVTVVANTELKLML